MYNCIFLDLDGTVLDFAKSERHAFFCAMEALGIPVDDGDLARYHDINAALWRALERGEISDSALRPLRFERLLSDRGTWDWRAVNEAYVSHLACAGIPYPGAVELVRALHERYRVCVLTNGGRYSQQKRLEGSGLAPYVELMLTSEEAGAAKPAPDMFFMAMERLGDTDPAHYLMLGDSLSADIAGARNAGVDAMWYAPDRAEQAAAIAPDYRVCNYFEIAQILLPKLD